MHKMTGTVCNVLKVLSHSQHLFRISHKRDFCLSSSSSLSLSLYLFLSTAAPPLPALQNSSVSLTGSGSLIPFSGTELTT